MSKVTDIVEDEAFTFSSNEQVHQWEVISQLLEAKLKALEDIDQDILSLCNVDEIPQEIEESERYVEKVITCQKKISNVSQPTAGDMQEPPDPLAGLIQVLPGGVSLSVPTSLPKFHGEVTTWMGFWYSYKSAVHDNVNLSKIDKFNYLRSLLQGAASQAIQGLALSSDNYDSTVEILEQRFGKTQQIISAYMEEILKLQPCLTDCPSCLQFLYDKLSVHVQGLSSLRVSSGMWQSVNSDHNV